MNGTMIQAETVEKVGANVSVAEETKMETTKTVLKVELVSIEKVVAGAHYTDAVVKFNGKEIKARFEKNTDYNRKSDDPLRETFSLNLIGLDRQAKELLTSLGIEIDSTSLVENYIETLKLADEQKKIDDAKKVRTSYPTLGPVVLAKKLAGILESHYKVMVTSLEQYVERPYSIALWVEKKHTDPNGVEQVIKVGIHADYNGKFTVGSDRGHMSRPERIAEKVIDQISSECSKIDSTVKAKNTNRAIADIMASELPEFNEKLEGRSTGVVRKIIKTTKPHSSDAKGVDARGSLNQTTGVVSYGVSVHGKLSADQVKRIEAIVAIVAEAGTEMVYVSNYL